MSDVMESKAMDLPPTLSVVIPCYNEEQSLSELASRVASVCHACVGEDYELILVNDGSKDATWLRMEALARTNPRITAVNLSRNYGHQLALSAGLSMSQGQRIFILDADLQDPPELLDSMMKRMDNGVDVVYGQRTRRKGETLFKTFSAYIFYRVLGRMVEIDIPADTGDFRLMSRRALDVLNRMPENHRFIRGMVSWIGFRQEPILYERSARFAGETKYPLTKMLRFALDAITGFSVRPLRLASYLGGGFGIVGLLTLFYVFLSWLSGDTVQGWTSLIAVVLVLGSAQLLVLGVLGEYIGRLYIESKKRPLYVIQDIKKFGDDPG